MVRISNEEYLAQIAMIKASGMKTTEFCRLMGWNEHTVSITKLALRRRGMTTEEIDDQVSMMKDAMKSYMGVTENERSKFISLFEEIEKLGLNDADKSAALSRHFEGTDIDEYWYRKMRTGYQYYMNVFDKLTDEEKRDTVNSHFVNDGEKIHFVIKGDRLGGGKSSDVAESVSAINGPKITALPEPEEDDPVVMTTTSVATTEQPVESQPETSIPDITLDLHDDRNDRSMYLSFPANLMNDKARDIESIMTKVISAFLSENIVKN